MYLKNLDKSDSLWRKFQIDLYQHGILKSEVSDYFLEFANFAIMSGIKLKVVSMRSEILRKVALQWLALNFPPNFFDSINFSSNITDKIKKINEFKPIMHIDDLEKILINPQLNDDIIRFLYVNSPTTIKRQERYFVGDFLTAKRLLEEKPELFHKSEAKIVSQ